MRSLGSWVAILVIAALLSIYSLRDARTGLAIAAAVLATAVLFVDGGRRDFFVRHGWIPWAWVALCLAPDFRFTFRSTPLDTSVANASLENYIQVGVYALVAVLVLRARHILVTEEPRPIRKGPLIAWPSIAVLSTVWSLVPLFTLVRSLQLLVPIGLATVMTRIWLSAPHLAAALWRKTLRLFVQTVTLLVVLGFATGPWRERFTWPGTHAGVAAAYCGCALLILVGSRRSDLRFGATSFWCRVALFAAAIFLARTRSVLAGLLIASAVLLWWAGRRKPISRYLGSFYYMMAIALSLIAASGQVIDYLGRGATLKANLTLTGRVGLWEASLDLAAENYRWLAGFGYGAARVVLPLHSDWNAGTAHSAWVELLLSIGILGPILLAAYLAFLIRHASSPRAIIDPRPTTSLVVFLLVTSLTGEMFAFPSLGFTILALIYAPVLAARSALPADAELGPQPTRRRPVRSGTGLASGGWKRGGRDRARTQET